MSDCLRLILDIDGTLLDSIAAHERAFNAALQAVGLPTVMEWGGEILEYTDGWVLEALYRSVHDRAPTPEEQVDFETVFQRAFRQDLNERALREIPGAGRFLQSLQERTSVSAVFATGSFGAVAREKLMLFGANAGTLSLVSSSGYVRREDIARDALSQLPGDGLAVVVGDGEWDRKIAATCSLGFLGINFSSPRGEEGPARECFLADFADLDSVWSALHALADSHKKGA